MVCFNAACCSCCEVVAGSSSAPSLTKKEKSQAFLEH